MTYCIHNKNRSLPFTDAASFMKNALKLTLISFMLIVASGCATNRGVLDIERPTTQNPAQGEAIKFVKVTDNRQFQIKPPQANIPSLKNNEIDDPAITSRAIARKRNTYGKALGDILLPEGVTVMDVVENRIAEGFKENGYRVLKAGDSGYEDATPISIDIDKFWGWFSPGFWSIGLNFETSIRLTAPVAGFSEGIEFNSQVTRNFQTASGRNWQAVADASLEALSRDIQGKLQIVRSTTGNQ